MTGSWLMVCFAWGGRNAGAGTADSLHKVCRGVSLGKWDGYHVAAGGFNFLSAGNLVGGPIRALDKHAREHAGNQFSRSRLIENRYVVHGGERGQYFGAILLRDERPFGPLVVANAAVAIDRYDQHIAQGPRLSQTAHVARMEQI